VKRLIFQVRNAELKLTDENSGKARNSQWGWSYGGGWSLEAKPPIAARGKGV